MISVLGLFSSSEELVKEMACSKKSSFFFNCLSAFEVNEPWFSEFLARFPRRKWDWGRPEEWMWELLEDCLSISGLPYICQLAVEFYLWTGLYSAVVASFCLLFLSTLQWAKLSFLGLSIGAGGGQKSSSFSDCPSSEFCDSRPYFAGYMSGTFLSSSC